MTLDLAALEALIAKATPGPWRKGADSMASESPSVFIDHDTPHPYTGMCLARIYGRADRMEERHANAALIVAAVNALPELIARIRELERERDRYHDALLSRHGGEPLALLDELDTARAEIRTAALAMRERCAHVCNEIADIHPEARTVATICAAAIRAIGP